MLDPIAGEYLFFAAVLPDELLAKFFEVSANPIAEVEAMAILVGMVLLAERLRGRAVLLFVDNEPAKHAVARGTSRSALLADITEKICEAEIRSRALLWAERVASADNSADPPSRGEAPPELAGWPEPQQTAAEDITADCDSTEHQYFRGLRDVSVDK